MSYRVRIESFDRDIEVGEDETILSAALDAGLDYPFMCQQGQCGSCKSFLIAGEVDLGDVYNPLVLTEAERRRGLILACQAQPLSDCIVAVGEIDGQVAHVVREIACIIAAIEPTSAASLVALAPAAGERFNFSAGQSATLTLPGLPPRDYAMASRPDDPLLRFHIAPPLASLAIGDRVMLRGPFGDITLREEHLGPILLAAEGASVAAIEAIIETALALGMTQRIYLYLGTGALYRREYLGALAARHRNLTLVTPAERSLAETIAADFDDCSAFHAYVAGPPSQDAAIRDALIERGLPAEACFVLPSET